MADYQAQRTKNIEANKALLLSLGLEKLQNFAPAAVSAPKPKPVVHKPKPKAKPQAPKRKRDEVDDLMSVDGEVKAQKLDETEENGGRRRLRRRATQVKSYNEDDLFDKKEKAKKEDDDYKPGKDDELETYELGEDRAGRAGNRLGERQHDPKQFGSIPGVPVGTWWMTRAECSTAAIHAPFVAGIYGGAKEGAYSVALSGGYDDDVDLGYAFTYTGCGGRDLKGTAEQPKNLRTAPQSSDQTFDNPKNMALKVSSETRKPVRVIRGYKLPSIYAPESGYRYDGLYVVEKAWTEPGLNPQGYKVVKFAFKRLPNQPAIPEKSDEEGEEEPTEDASSPAESLKQSDKDEAD